MSIHKKHFTSMPKNEINKKNATFVFKKKNDHKLGEYKEVL